MAQTIISYTRFEFEFNEKIIDSVKILVKCLWKKLIYNFQNFFSAVSNVHNKSCIDFLSLNIKRPVK